MSDTLNSKRSPVGSVMLFLTALIWGLAFVAQSEGAKYIGAFTFNSLRFFIGALVLVPCVILFDRLRGDGRRLFSIEGRRLKLGILREEWIGGALCGIVLCCASVLQQLGVEIIGSGKSGFLTSLYIVIVPIFSAIFKNKVRLPVWIGAAVALVGAYLMSVAPGDGFSIGRGEIYVIISALVYSVHIIMIDHLSPKADGVRVSMIQFATAAIVALPFMLLLERPSLGNIVSASIPLLYAGVMSSGVAYTLQILGQKRTSPTLASLLMSLESVFSALGGMLIIGEKLTTREYIGCAVLFLAVVFTNLTESRRQSISDK